MTVFKIYFYVFNSKLSANDIMGNPDMVYFVIAVVPGGFTILINLHGFIQLSLDRRSCKLWLEDQLHSSNPAQQQVAQRLLRKHWGQVYRIDTALSPTSSTLAPTG